MGAPPGTELARKLHRTLEPIHGMIYFVPEAAAAYAAAGLTGERTGYFASRAAPMGAVPAEVVIATFNNFEPGLVRSCIPRAWEEATPSRISHARLEGADGALRRLLGDDVGSDAMAEAAALARRATDGCRLDGRPLYAGHASLPWPDDAHLALWHAQTLLREHRGDAHVAALADRGIGGLESLVLHAGTGEVDAELLRTTRAWSADAWAAAADGLRARGWLDADGALTPLGREVRGEVEQRTDEAMVGCVAALGEDGCGRLRELARPWSRAIVERALDPRALPRAPR